MEESRVRVSLAHFEIGSESQRRVFRESRAESMPFAFGTLPKKNSREIAPFRRGANHPLEQVAQKFYPVSIKLLQLHYPVRGT